VGNIPATIMKVMTALLLRLLLLLLLLLMMMMIIWFNGDTDTGRWMTSTSKQ
jgi:hypothetical protein